MKPWHHIWMTVVLASGLLGSGCAGAEPDVEEIGRILGYPVSGIVITDVTGTEREIHSMRNLREEEKGIDPPVDPERIRSAYRITGRTPASFLPILITVADEGAFLSPEFRGLLNQLAAVPKEERDDPWFAHWGRFKLGEDAEGGILMAELRTPSRIREMGYPSAVMATISELRFPKQKIDIRVAMQVGLDEGGNVELEPVPGGERYHGYFWEPRDRFGERSPDAVDFDWVEGLKALNRVALKAYKAEPGTAAPDSRTPGGSAPLAGPGSPGGAAASLDPDADGGSAVIGNQGSLLAFAVAGALVLVLSVALVKRKLE